MMMILTTHAMVAWTAAVFAWGSFGRGWLGKGDDQQQLSSGVKSTLPYTTSVPLAETIQQGAKQAISGAVSRGSELAREATDELSSMVQSGATETRDAAMDAVEWTRGKATDALHWTKEAANTAQNKASRLLHHFQRIMGIQRDPPQSVKVRILPEEYYLVIDAPGLAVEAVTVQVARDQLIVTGQGERCWRGSRGQRVCVEKGVEEVFELPEDAEQAEIASWMDSQMLIVKIPRKAIVADHVVQVKPAVAPRESVEL